MDCNPRNCPGQNTGVGSLSLLQGIFPTQGSNPGLPHCRWILYQLSHKGSPRILGWVAYPFSSRSSQPRNRTRVSCIAGEFFTNWAIREALFLSNKPEFKSTSASCYLCDYCRDLSVLGFLSRLPFKTVSSCLTFLFVGNPVTIVVSWRDSVTSHCSNICFPASLAAEVWARGLGSANLDSLSVLWIRCLGFQEAVNSRGLILAKEPTHSESQCPGQ